MHDRHEYEKDRERVRDVYVGHNRGREGGVGVIGTGGSGIVDLGTYLAVVEEGDGWWDGRGEGEGEDPWLLPPVGEIV